MKILWKSSLSGLADRLMDLFLMATVSKCANLDLCVLWAENKDITEFQLKVWPKERFSNWRPEVFLEYLQLPSFIEFLEEEKWNSLNTDKNYIFSDYLGGVYSPNSFYDKFYDLLKKDLQVNFSKSTFESEFYQLLHSFRPTKRLELALNNIAFPDISVHLRRTDKVVASPDAVQIHTKELKFLNEITKTCLEDLISKNSASNKKINIYFCSDDPLIKNKWEKLYKGNSKINVLHTPESINSIESTYFDLFMLSRSKFILLSQMHSNFSLFASLINQSKLIYLFKNNPFGLNNSFKNMFFFKPSIFQKLRIKFNLFLGSEL